MGADHSTLRARQQHFHELKVSLVTIVSSRLAWAYRVDLVSKSKAERLERWLST